MNPRYIPLIFFFLLSILKQIELNGQNIIPTRNFANNGYDYIDSTTKKIVSQYTYDQAFPFSEGLARVSRNGLWGFIDKNGDEVIKPRFRFADDFSEGLVVVGNEVVDTTINGKVQILYDNRYGMLDKSGKVIIDFKFGPLGKFKGDLCRAMDLSTSKWGWINKAGNWVYPAIYYQNQDFNALGFAIVAIENEESYVSAGDTIKRDILYKGIINKAGKFVVPPIYADLQSQMFYPDAKQSDDNYIIAIKYNTYYEWGKYGYINIKGETLIPFLYDQASWFNEGFAVVGMNYSNTMKFGYIDRSGKMNIPAIYEFAQFFNKGKAFIKYKNRFGWIDKHGVLIGQKSFDMAEDFHRDYSDNISGNSKFALVSNNGFWGAVTSNLQEIVPIEYDSIAKSGNGIIAKKSNRLYLFDEKGNLCENCITVSPIDLSDANIQNKQYSSYLETQDEGNIQQKKKAKPNYTFSVENGLPINVTALKKGKYYGLFDSNDLTQLTEYEYDSLRSISINQDMSTWGIVGYHKNEIDMISIEFTNNSITDKKKSVIIPTNYNEIGYLNNNYFSIKKNNMWGVGIMKDYQIIEIIRPIYEDIGSFDTNNYGKQLQLIPLKYNGKWGFGNLLGEIEIPFQFQDVAWFNFEKNCFVKKNNKWGMINNKGELIFPYDLDDLNNDCVDQMCEIKKEGKWGYLHENGNLIAPTIFDRLGLIYEHQAEVWINKRKLVIESPHGTWSYYYKDGYSTYH
jgi:hypothetical protein